MLESGLPETVSDEETLARFLTQKDQYARSQQASGTSVAKASAFLPYPKYRNTSVFRQKPETRELAELRRIWSEVNTVGRSLKAIAFVQAGDIRKARLEVNPEEPPPAHANIEKWPWYENDALTQKSEQLELAAQVAAASEVIIL